MITLMWCGVFSCAKLSHPITRTIEFEGADVTSVLNLIAEFIDSKKDLGWVLEDQEILRLTERKYDNPATK